MLTGLQQADQMCFLPGVELGLFAPQMALRLCHPHALARSGAVGLGFGHHRQDVEQQPPDRVVRVVHRAADTELHVGLGEFAYDVAGVGEGAGAADGVYFPVGGRRVAAASTYPS